MEDFLVVCGVLHGRQVGEVGGVDDGYVQDRSAGGRGCLLLGVECAVLDQGADVEPGDVDALVGHLRLQYREPAFIDVMLMTYPESEHLAALARAVTDMTTEIVEDGRDTRVLRADLTPRRPVLGRRRRRPRAARDAQATPRGLRPPHPPVPGQPAPTLNKGRFRHSRNPVTPPPPGPVDQQPCGPEAVSTS